MSTLWDFLHDRGTDSRQLFRHSLPPGQATVPVRHCQGDTDVQQTHRRLSCRQLPRLTWSTEARNPQLPRGRRIPRGHAAKRGRWQNPGPNKGRSQACSATLVNGTVIPKDAILSGGVSGSFVSAHGRRAHPQKLEPGGPRTTIRNHQPTSRFQGMTRTRILAPRRGLRTIAS
jgi:hypothetical protein